MIVVNFSLLCSFKAFEVGLKDFPCLSFSQRGSVVCVVVLNERVSSAWLQAHWSGIANFRRQFGSWVITDQFSENFRRCCSWRASGVVVTATTLAQNWARKLSLIAITILFLTTTLLTSTTFLSFFYLSGAWVFGLKCLGVSLKNSFNCCLSDWFVLLCVKAFLAVTRTAVYPRCETFTVKFKTLWILAVTFLTIARHHCREEVTKAAWSSLSLFILSEWRRLVA
jgi:hypothetical protein